MTRIGVFSGSFLPLSKGQVDAARAFMEQMWLDILYVLPTSSDPNAVRICRAAFADVEGVYVSDAALSGKSELDLLRELTGEDERRLFLLTDTAGMLSLGEHSLVQEIFSLAYPCYYRNEKDPLLDALIVKRITQYRDRYGKVVRRILTEQ